MFINRLYCNKKVDNKKIIIILFLIFIFSSAIRSILSLKTATVSIIYDELLYWDISKSIYQNSAVMFRNLLISNKDIFYSLLISWVHSLGNVEMAYQVLLVCNAVMMSTVVFPVYLLSKEILEKKGMALGMAMVSVILPEMFYTTCILQENLYYPLMMWVVYFFVKYISGDKYHFGRIAVYSILLTFIGYVKNIGLCILVAFVLFYFINIFIEKNKKKKLYSAVSFIEIFMIYYVLKKIVDLICMKIFATGKGDSVSSLGTDALKNLLDIKGYLSYIYPIVSYCFYGILVFGVFTIIIVYSYYKCLNSKDKNLLLYCTLAVLVTMGVVCLLVIKADMEVGEKIVRVHMRYFFYFFVPILILFFKLYNTAVRKGLNKLCIFMAGIVILLAIFSPSEVSQGSTVDAVGIDSLRAFFMTPFRQRCLKVLVIAGIITGCFLLYKKYTKILYACVCVMLLSLTIHSTHKAYRTSMWEKEALTEMRNDGERLTQALKNKVTENDDVLIVAINQASSGVMETRLEIPYRVCTIDDFQSLVVFDNRKIDFFALDFWCIDKYSLIKYDNPEFIIVQGELDIPGYECNEDIGLKNYKVYEKRVY